jgi:hypothetical protein
MGALVTVESCILALTMGTALAQSLSTTSSTRAGPIGIYAGASYSEIWAVRPARGLISEAAPAPVRPFAFTRVDINIGPLIDMDNSRRQDEDRQKKREKESREQAQREESRWPYGRYGSAYPLQDLYHYNYSNNRYYYDPRGITINPVQDNTTTYALVPDLPPRTTGIPVTVARRTPGA